MDAIIKYESHDSSFDQIKQVDTDGREYWLARDFMPVLGYQQWRQFEDAISRAIARLKEAIHHGWCNNPTGLFINSCKSRAKGKNVVTTQVSAWFEWARRERIAFPAGVAAGIAMSSGVVYTSEGNAVKVEEMMRRYQLED
jgi:hypothetical protein